MAFALKFVLMAQKNTDRTADEGNRQAETKDGDTKIDHFHFGVHRNMLTFKTLFPKHMLTVISYLVLFFWSD